MLLVGTSKESILCHEDDVDYELDQ